jgi:hypothetical protein
MFGMNCVLAQLEHSVLTVAGTLSVPDHCTRFTFRRRFVKARLEVIGKLVLRFGANNFPIEVRSLLLRLGQQDVLSTFVDIPHGNAVFDQCSRLWNLARMRTRRVVSSEDEINILRART